MQSLLMNKKFLTGMKENVYYCYEIRYLLSRRDQVFIQRLRTRQAAFLQNFHRSSMSEEEICEFPSCEANHIPVSIEHYFLQCPAHNLSETELKDDFNL